MTQKRYVIGPASSLPPGERTIVEIAGLSIGIFNVEGALYAIRNRCPHQGAPLCQGSLSGTMLPSAPGTYQYGLEGRVLRCPWHAWEFDVTTGRTIFMPTQRQTQTYRAARESSGLERFDIEVEEEVIVLYL